MFTLLVFAAPPPDTLVVRVPGVTVTGTRTNETQLRAPAAITVVPRGSFTHARGVSLKDALTLVPGVLAQSRAGAQDVRITIRGFGARGNGERSNVGSMRGIRVMTDGLDVTEPDGRTSLDLVDLSAADEVEVTRSNASAHYGNASGGIIHLRTRLDFEQPWAELRERAGSFGYHREEGRAGLALGKTRGVATLLNSTLDGWRDRSSNWISSFQLRTTTPLDASSRLGVVLDAVTDLFRFPGALTQAQFDADPRQANAYYVARDERRRNRIGRLGLSFGRATANQDLAVTTFVQPKVLQRSERNRFRDFNRYQLGANATYQLRSQLSRTLAGRVGAGVDEGYQDGAILFYDLAADGGRGPNLQSNQREGSNAAGGFIEGELRWNDRWSLRMSARFDALRYLSEDHMDPSLNATKDFTKWTPKGAVAWNLDEHTLYAALGGGVEAPAFNEIDPPPPYDTLTSLNPFLEPMQSTTYELGAKGHLADLGAFGQVGYDAALYWIDVTNEIVPFDGGAYFLTAGKTRRRGVEMGLQWRPTSPLTIEGSLAFTNNEYVTYAPDSIDRSGNDVPGLPSTQMSWRARYESALGLSAEVATETVGDYFADDANTASVSAYTILNGALAYGFPFAGSTLRAFVAANNLTDRKYVASVFINGVNGEYYEPGMPQNWTAGVTLRFP